MTISRPIVCAALAIIAVAVAGCDDSNQRGDGANRSSLGGDLRKLQGTWYSLSTEWDGEQKSGENHVDLHIFSGTHCTATLDGVVVGESEVTLTPPKKGNPGTITFEMKFGKYTGKTWVGIYEVTDSSARWCGAFADENSRLPARFATTSGDQTFMRAMKRQ